jgi:hypothetical protein
MNLATTAGIEKISLVQDVIETFDELPPPE